MANFSSTYPATKPVFQADFANGGRIDPRATFSRSDTPPTYAAPSAVHYWSNEKHLSSENVLTYSSTFDNPVWLGGGASRTGGQTDPAGGSNAYTLLEDTTSTYHNAYQNVSGNESWALTVYGKQNTGSRYLQLRLYGGSANNYETAVFDLAGSAPSTASGSSSGFANVSATQTASGNGFYKCTLKGTGSITFVAIHISQNSTATGLDAYGVAPYTGDNTSSIDVAFASLSTVGATDYNATTTQIHRAYAPSLKSVGTAGAARFEYDPVTNVSRGILIESQATNLATYSEDSTQWTKAFSASTATASSAVGPDGTLNAALWVPGATANMHYVHHGSVSVTSGTAYTGSVFLKGHNNTRAQLAFGSGGMGFGYANFSLSGSGSVLATGGGASAKISSCGNGWFRVTLTATAVSTTSTSGLIVGYIDSDSDTRLPTKTGNSYNGLLVTGFQFESGSHSSSYIKVEGSTATRAFDSLSIATADIGYTGGPFTIVSETEGGKGSYPRAWAISDGSIGDRLVVYRNSGAASDSTDWYCHGNSDGSAQVSSTITSSASAGKLAVSCDTNDVSTCASGGTVTTDTAAVVSGKLTTLRIGAQTNGVNNQLNGHVKRVALYNEALSDTNLQALTS